MTALGQPPATKTTTTEAAWRSKFWRRRFEIVVVRGSACPCSDLRVPQGHAGVEGGHDEDRCPGRDSIQPMAPSTSHGSPAHVAIAPLLTGPGGSPRAKTANRPSITTDLTGLGTQACDRCVRKRRVLIRVLNSRLLVRRGETGETSGETNACSRD
jgi:hypothetical protein